MVNRTRLMLSSVVVCACLLALHLAAGAAWAQDPFACTGEAFIVQNLAAELTQIDQTVDPFAFVPNGDPVEDGGDGDGVCDAGEGCFLELPAGTSIGVNNLGFNRTNGLLYAANVDASTPETFGIIQIDETGTVLDLGLPAGLPGTEAYLAGDVTPDGATMYLHTQSGTTLYIVDLGLFTATSVAVTGGTGQVLDWTVNPINGLLYGGDRTDGELAILNPTGVRTDVAVGGGGLPAGIAYGAAWFNAAGQLFLYRNDQTSPASGTGELYRIDLAGPTVLSTQTGPGSVRNDGAACIQDVIGAAKSMTIGRSFPAPVTIDYVFENFSPVSTLNLVSVIDDLTAVFGAHGTDWTFTSISSTPAAFHNPGFDGHTDTELINQAPAQSVAPLATATVTVMLTLLTDAGDTDGDGEICNQVLVTGDLAGVPFGDLSTDGSDPDPNGDSSPDEREPSCAPVPMGTPGLSLVKTGALDLGPDGIANPGDLINYTFLVTNTGDVPLTNVSVSDPMVSPITCPSGNPIPTLAVGASETCTGSYAITQADIDAGQKDNTATADSDQTPPVTDDHMEPIPQTPGLDLVKDGALDLGPDGIANPGDLINYTFLVTNTGNVPLTNVSVTDPMVSPITCPSGNPIPTLAVGASETCTGSYAITQADIDAGQKDNTATADSDQTPPVTDDHMEPIPTPGLDLVKDGALDLGGDGVANPGDLINYTFLVTNTGNVPLTNVSVTDPMVSPITCPSGNPIPTLAVGASETCTGSYAITQADIDAGQKDNTATADSDQTPPVTDDHMEPIPQTPGLDLVKDGALDLGGDGVANPGDFIDYTFVVTNTGNVTLTNVSVSDPLVDPITCPSGNPIPTLAVGASETCTGSYAITQADIDAGERDNTATADSDQTPPVTDGHTEPIPQPEPPIVDIPTLGHLGLLLLALGLAGAGARRLRRRR